MVFLIKLRVNFEQNELTKLLSNATTLSPILNFVIEDPTLTTSPAISVPEPTKI